jgi:alpha-1,2-mannosyltransferase
LRAEAESLGIVDNVVFVVDAPFTDLHGWLCTAQIGLHTMWNEHFGISVVEMMAAGLTTVAHNSGGPKMDLIVPVSISDSLRTQQESNLCTGYLAATATEYADCIGAALDSYAVSLPLRQRARNASQRFSDSNFMTSVAKIFSDII